MYTNCSLSLMILCLHVVSVLSEHARGASDRRELYLGQLYPSEEYKMYHQLIDIDRETDRRTDRPRERNSQLTDSTLCNLSQ